MPGQNRKTQFLWLLECRGHPKEVTAFIETGDKQPMTVEVPSPHVTYSFWLFRDDCDTCYYYI